VEREPKTEKEEEEGEGGANVRKEESRAIKQKCRR
jgi:hypothetical protein